MKRMVIAKGILFPLLALAAPSVVAQVLSPQELFRRVSPSVVLVEVWGEYSETDGSEIIARGSGVIIPSGRGDNVIATNCHLTDKSGSPFFSVSGVGDVGGIGMNHGRDAERDLCTITALLVDRKHAGKDAEPDYIKLPPVQIASSKGLEVGDTVYAVGAPQGLEATLSNGIVSGFRQHKGVEYIQTTAPISQGSSGGGLFNSQGQLVGITTMFIKEGQALNFAIPAELIASISGIQRASQPAPQPAAREPERSQERHDRWILVAESVEGTKIYVDTKTVRRDGSDVTVWIKSELEKPKADKAGDTYDEEVTLDTYHCASRQRTRKYYSQRLRDSLVYSKELKSYEIQRSNITPDTVGEGIYDEVCGS